MWHRLKQDTLKTPITSRQMCTTEINYSDVEVQPQGKQRTYIKNMKHFPAFIYISRMSGELVKSIFMHLSILDYVTSCVSFLWLFFYNVQGNYTILAKYSRYHMLFCSSVNQTLVLGNSVWICRKKSIVLNIMLDWWRVVSGKAFVAMTISQPGPPPKRLYHTGAISDHLVIQVPPH